jgi:hypothetical protein
MLQVTALSFAPRAMRLDTRALASSDPNHAGITGLQYYGKGGWVRACIAATYLEVVHKFSYLNNTDFLHLCIN